MFWGGIYVNSNFNIYEKINSNWLALPGIMTFELKIQIFAFSNTQVNIFLFLY